MKKKSNYHDIQLRITQKTHYGIHTYFPEFSFPVQASTLIIATFGFYSDFFITFDGSNWRRIIRDAMDGTHPKVL